MYNQTKRKNKKLLGDLGDFALGTMAIGRLDEKSEGLLLLTTDGKISEYIRSSKVEKEYLVEVEGNITHTATTRLKNGVNISLNGTTYKTAPCKVKILTVAPALAENPGKKRSSGHGSTSWLSITLTEGKYRQVRKMTAAVGHPTFRLIRNRIGNITLKDLAPGQYREVKTLQV